MCDLQINYHHNNSPYHLAPDFSFIGMNDEASIAKCLKIVFAAKSKQCNDQLMQQLLSNIVSITKEDKIGSLRNLSSTDWNSIELPLICKIYLRHLLVQSYSYSNICEKLEFDFHFGLKYDWSLIEPQVSKLIDMGFTRDDAYESLTVNDHNIPSAVVYLAVDEQTRNREYEQQKRTKNRIKRVRVRTHTNTNTCKKKPIANMIQRAQHMSESQLLQEIQRMKTRLSHTKFKRRKLQQAFQELEISNAITLYESYLRGMIANGILTADKVLELERYRQTHAITDAHHISALSNIGYSEIEFDALKVFTHHGTATTTGGARECVVCYDEIKDSCAHMFLPCNHICVCAACIEFHYPAPHNEQKCPLCCQSIADIPRVYFT
jgi:hypothetical protein